MSPAAQGVDQPCEGFDGTIAVHRPDYTATIKPVQRPDGHGFIAEILWELHWTDYVANEWHEQYGTLPLALMRLAALDFAVATDSTFTHDQTTFAALAAIFLEGTSE